MRFPRQARIFRGHLDPAPIAAMMFLLVIFMQLGSLLYTPGVLIQLQNTSVNKNPAATTISVKADGRVLFGTNVFTEKNLESLRDALKESHAGPPFGLAADPVAPKKLVEKVNALFPIELADGSTNLFGTANPKVVVEVNFLGQYFYDDRLIGADDLKKELKKSLRAASRESKELVLMVWAAKQVDFNAVSRLLQLAGEAGIKDAFLVERSVAPAAIPSKQAP